MLLGLLGGPIPLVLIASRYDSNAPGPEYEGMRYIEKKTHSVRSSNDLYPTERHIYCYRLVGVVVIQLDALAVFDDFAF